MPKKSKKSSTSQEVPISQAETYDELGEANDHDEMVEELDESNEHDQIDELGEGNEYDGVNELDEANDDVASERINKLLENEFVVIKNDNGSQRQVKGLSLMEICYLTRTERIVVECSEEYIPNNKASYLLSSFYYDIVKRGSFAPISILNWKDPAFEPYKTKMRKIIEGKFMYSDPAGIVQKWVFRKMNTGWRPHKVKLKKIFETHKTVKAALQKAPDNVVLDQWRILVADWGSEKKKQKHHHTLGRKSCARKRKQMEDANDGEVVDRLTLWEAAHKKKDGSYINEATKEKMIEANYLKETLLQNSEVDTSLVAEKVFKEVMGPERGGCVRGIVIGPSPTEYFRMKSSAKSNGMSSNNQISTLTERYERKIATLKEHHDGNRQIG
ncbi:hypothetical protein LUZ60_016699 [Juncus effusus]|nr:hypothetical protein LUZ60_016699 [Juncus effusus]